MFLSLRGSGLRSRGSCQDVTRQGAALGSPGLRLRGTGAAQAIDSLVSVPSLQNLTYEIILTLGQAFEVAYQLALQAQRAKPLGAAAGDTIETKSSKPVPKPRAGVRKSAVRVCGLA